MAQDNIGLFAREVMPELKKQAVPANLSRGQAGLAPATEIQP